MKKLCCNCKTEKPISEFSLKNTKTGSLQNMCKICQSEYSKQHYVKNKQHYIEKAARNNKKYLDRNSIIISNAKSSGCKLCDEKCPACLDFHHLKGEDKLNNVSNLQLHSQAYLQKEIAKCIILCSNCHRKLHAGIISI